MPILKLILKTLVALAFLNVGVAMAATCTAKTGARNWGSASSWTGCGVPKDGDVVVIPSGSTVTLNVDTNDIASVTVADGGVLLGDANDNKLKLKSPGDFTNNGTVTLNGAKLDIKGNFVNNGTFNAGSDKIQIDGNFSNSGTFNAQTSKLEFDGNGVQTVTGNVTFNDLKVDNGSGNGLLLNGNVVVNGALSGDAVSAGLVKLADTCPVNYTLTSNGGATVQNSCPGGGGPVAEYRFDELTWNGSPGEVLDNSSAGVNGTAINGATTVVGKVCNAASFNGTNQYVLVSGLGGLLSGTATLSFWINTTQSGNDTSWKAPGVTGIEHDGGIDDVFWGWINKDGKIAISKGNTLGARSSAAINNGMWRHIVLTRDQASGATKIYVDGVLNNTKNSDKNVVTKVFASIGRIQNTNGSAKYLQGLLDELKIFDGVLSDAQVSSIYANENAGKNWDGSARICPVAGPHHLEIQSSASGLTCAASTLTVRACANAACTTLYTGGVSGTLSATGTPSVNWDGTTGGATGAGFVIPAGSSSVTKNVQVATAGSVVFGISAATPVPTSATVCTFGSPSCTFTAQTAGFIFSNAATGSSYTIPAQVSGVASANLYLRALETSASNPAVCTPAIVGQTTDVNLGYTCNNPSTCQPGSLAKVNATTISQTGSAVSLSFDGNGSAPVTLRYDDVGQITFNASKTVTPIGSGTPATLAGNSNPLVVAPHHFGFSAITAGPIRAGRNFSATVTAYNGLAMPTATPNFGKEATPEQVTINRVRYKPSASIAGTSDGVFSGSVGAFHSGSATASNLNWSEVGIIDLTATLTSGSYLSSGLSASGSTGSTGAITFIPDHFDTVVALTGGVPMPCPTGLTCPVQYNGFVYSGQGAPLTITAKNGLATATTTVNYNYSAIASESFSRAVTLSAVAAVGGSAIATTAPGGTVSAVAIPASSFSAGSTTTPAYPVFSFASPLTAPIDVFWRATDSDHVSSLRSTPASSVEGGVKVVSGRLKIANAYGSELLTLPMAVTAQYYNGTSWVTSATDGLSLPGGTVTATAVAGTTLCAGLGFATTPLAVNAGKGSITLTRPSNGRCSADISLTAPAYLPSASGRATFGIYKSPLIYRRENY